MPGPQLRIPPILPTPSLHASQCPSCPSTLSLSPPPGLVGLSLLSMPVPGSLLSKGYLVASTQTEAMLVVIVAQKNVLSLPQGLQGPAATGSPSLSWHPEGAPSSSPCALSFSSCSVPCSLSIPAFLPILLTLPTSPLPAPSVPPFHSSSRPSTLPPSHPSPPSPSCMDPTSWAAILVEPGGVVQIVLVPGQACPAALDGVTFLVQALGRSFSSCDPHGLSWKSPVVGALPAAGAQFQAVLDGVDTNRWTG